MALKPVPKATLDTSVAAKITVITPEAAQRLLAANVKNRPLNPTRVARLADTLRSKRWRLNGDTIKVDSKGRLLDGQHRLHACAQTGISMPAILVTGLDPEVFDTIDQGTGRSGGDIFYMCGVRNPAVVSAAIVIVYQSRNGITEGNSQQRFKPDMDQRVALFDSLRTFEDRVSEVVREKNALRGFPLATFAGMHYLFSEKSVLGAQTFLRACSLGHGQASHPGEMLRKKLDWLSRQPYTVSTLVKCALMKVAWNAFAAGGELDQLEIPETVEFPINGITSRRWLGEGV